jgi:hypothetical protein
MPEEKNRIAEPVNATVDGFHLNGIPVLVIMDMRGSNGFLQIVEGDNPMVPPTPSIQINKGSMLVLLPDEVAEKVRPQLKAIERKREQGIGQGMIGVPLGPVPPTH